MVTCSRWRFDIGAGAPQHLGGTFADGALGCGAARAGGETQVAMPCGNEDLLKGECEIMGSS